MSIEGDRRVTAVPDVWASSGGVAASGRVAA